VVIAEICVVVSAAIVAVGRAAICAGVRAVMEAIWANSEAISTSDFTGWVKAKFFRPGGEHDGEKLTKGEQKKAFTLISVPTPH
jgi:hypothetical protein